MGLLSFFSSKARPGVHQLPSGSLTVDREGRMVASTISSSFPPQLLHEIGSHVLRLFSEARKAQMPLAELSLNFASMKITAREMRGGAIIFLAPNPSFNAST
jgi:hypothetical protein